MEKTGMITPAKFEDEIKKAKTLEEAVALMAATLDSLGYTAGLQIFMDMADKPRV